MLEESDISNTLTAALRPLTDASLVMALSLGRATALQPSSSRARLLRVCSPQGRPTKLVRPTGLMALEHLRLTTLLLRWLHHSSGGVVQLSLAPPGAERRCD